jgi:antitoxin YokJ
MYSRRHALSAPEQRNVVRSDLDLVAVVETVRRRDDCVVHEPQGAAAVELPLEVPDDLRRFYELCGHMVPFRDSSTPWRVLAAGDLILAARRLLAEQDSEQVLADVPDDVASTTVVFADQGGGATDEHVVLDLHPARLGQFYATFWDSFGLVGEMPIIAASVADILQWLVDSGGEGIEAALMRRPPLGDAYD